MIRSKHLIFILALLIAVLALVTACEDVVQQAQETGEAVIAEQLEPTADAAEEPTEEAAEAEHEEGVHWSYEGDTGPDHWAEINPDCGGKQQSPINVTGPAPEDLENITFNYGESAVKIFNNGHTIQVDVDDGSSFELYDVTYDLWQFHFHSPSEHTVEGVLADAELHLVHRVGDEVQAVIGVLIFAGEENPAFASVWANLPTEVSSTAQTIEGAFVNAEDLLPEVRTYYTYPGSLTTPPCSEGILWLLMTEPVEMSADQLAAFREIISGNNRPVQPLNDRELEVDTSSD